MKRWLGVVLSVMVAAGSLPLPVYAAGTGETAVEAIAETVEDTDALETEEPGEASSEAEYADEADPAEVVSPEDVEQPEERAAEEMEEGDPEEVDEAGLESSEGTDESQDRHEEHDGDFSDGEVDADYEILEDSSQEHDSSIAYDTEHSEGNYSWEIDYLTYTLYVRGTGEIEDFPLRFEAPWHGGNKDIFHIVVEEGITKLGDCCFSGLDYVRDIQLPNSLKIVGDSCFYDCKRIENITLPEGVTKICGSAFESMDRLKSVQLPNSLEIIGNYCFLDCESLENITIPEGVTNIGKEAFCNCQSLQRIRIPENTSAISDGLFKKCIGLENIYIGRSVSSIALSAFSDCGKLINIDVSSDNEFYASDDGVLYNKEFTTLIKCPPRHSGKEYTVKESTKTIEAEAFRECEEIERLTIADGVTRIQDMTFCNCINLQEIKLGKMLEYVGDDAFANCNSLTSVEFPGRLKSLGSNVFYRSEGKYRQSITFRGEAPECKNDTFAGTFAFIYYPYSRAESYESLCNTDFEDADLLWESSTTCTTNIKDCKISLSETSVEYDGSYKTPAVSISYYDAQLDLVELSYEDGDYTVTYSNNLNVGTAEVLIEGKYDYTGSVTRTFRIRKGYPSIIFESDPVTKKVTDSPFTNILELKTDGEVEFKSYNNDIASVDLTSGLVTIKRAGKTTISVTAKDSSNYYTKFASYTLIVEPETNNISDYTISIPAESYAYTGQAIEPPVTIKSGANTLTQGTDYSVAYSKNLNAGTAEITVTGMGAYTGTAQKTFTITKASPTLSFESASVSKKTSDSAFTNKLTKQTDGTVTFKSSNTAVATVNSSTGQVTIKGAGTARITASAAEGTNYSAGSASYTLTVVEAGQGFTVSYNANGGTGTPSAQIKQENVPLTLSSATPSKRFVISYNACGGTVSPASKNVSCIFKNWNTVKNGSGTSYAPGGSYTANADVTLYAQWTDPAAGALATPSRSGYVFVGWFTSASGGNMISDTTVITANMTVFAHWKNVYNLGDETYSFENYGDSDSFGGHCFGMSVTSAGYYNRLIDISRIGGNADSSLYSFSATQTVRTPICYYQGIQGSYSANAIVAGGSTYLTLHSNISSDWPAVVNYVKGHEYDGTGLLQIGFRKEGEGGHAINFLRYENVNGQDRIYAYDNNFPNQETYFYKNGSGSVLQAPVQTFSGAIDCIALRDVRTYFSRVGDFSSTHVLYMPKDAAQVLGYSYTYLEGVFPEEEYVMYEIPADQEKVTIVPNRDYADFIYMDREFSFSKVTDETRGELRFSTMDETSGGSDASFVIYENEPVNTTVTLSQTSYTFNGSVQKPAVTVKADGTLLKEGWDYTVEYPSGMIDAGTYEIKVTLTGSYSGTLLESFRIDAKPVTPSITLSNSSFVYNGSAQKPAVTVKAGSTTLTEGKDYTAAYSNNTGVGTGTVTVTCKGNYQGTAKQNFDIVLGKTTRGDMFNLANNVKVTWKEVPGAVYYKVYREGVTNTGESLKKPVIVTTGLVGWDKEAGLVNGHAYKYRIVASLTGKDDSSGDSKLSYSKLMYRLKTVVIRSVKNTAPGKVTVKYDKSTSGDSYVLQYCERQDMVGAKTKVVLGANNTSYVIGGLKKGKTYYISIRVRKKVAGIDYYTTFGVAKKVTITK